MQRFRSLVPALVSVGVAAAWIVVATGHPHRTYHLFPAAIAAAWPCAERVVHRGPLAGRRARRVAFAGTGVAMIVTAVLAVAGALAGPTVFDTGAAWAEALALATLGGAYGWRAASRTKPGIVFTR